MTSSKLLLLAALSCTAGAVLACGDKTASAVGDSATTTTSATDTLKVQGVWSDSITAESGYIAEYVNNKLVVIEEQMLLADRTISSRAYFYDTTYAPTRLFEHRALTAASSNSTPKMLHSLLNIYLTGDKIDSATKTVDRVAKTVQPYEIENARKHERVIFARVSKTYTAPRTDR